MSSSSLPCISAFSSKYTTATGGGATVCAKQAACIIKYFASFGFLFRRSALHSPQLFVLLLSLFSTGYNDEPKADPQRHHASGPSYSCHDIKSQHPRGRRHLRRLQEIAVTLCTSRFKIALPEIVVHTVAVAYPACDASMDSIEDNVITTIIMPNLWCCPTIQNHATTIVFRVGLSQK